MVQPQMWLMCIIDTLGFYPNKDYHLQKLVSFIGIKYDFQQYVHWLYIVIITNIYSKHSTKDISYNEVFTHILTHLAF